MKTKGFALILLIITSNVPLASQNLDYLMVKRQLECPDVSLNCQAYFIDYYREGKLDSAIQIVNYWQNKCGYRDPVFRAKLLLDLKTGHFNEWFVGNDIYETLYTCIYRYNTPYFDAANTFEGNKANLGFIQPQGEYDKAISLFAEELKPYYNDSSYERAWIDFLAHPSDSIYTKFQQGQYANTQLATQYAKRLSDTKALAEMHMALTGGIWIPNGRLSALGVHPNLGFQWGYHSQKLSWDLSMAIKFNDSKHSYYAYPYTYSEEMVQTDYFLGYYIGLDFAKCIYRHRHDDISILAGIGWDGFDVADYEYDPEANSTSSYNFNLGLGYSYFYNSYSYIGLQAKYNLVDYTLNHVMSLDGNAVTVNLVWGLSINPVKTQQLAKLGYYGR